MADRGWKKRYTEGEEPLRLLPTLTRNYVVVMYIAFVASIVGIIVPAALNASKISQKYGATPPAWAGEIHNLWVGIAIVLIAIIFVVTVLGWFIFTIAKSAGNLTSPSRNE